MRRVPDRNRAAGVRSPKRCRPLTRDGDRRKGISVRSKPHARGTALSLALIALAALALSSGAPAAPEPSQDSVVGSINEGIGIGFSISADVRSGPSGEAPTGTFSYAAGSPTQSTRLENATISCLAVSGNTAVLGGFGVLRSSGPGPTGPVVTTTPTGFIAIITDNGSPQPPPPGEPFPPSPDVVRLAFLQTPNCAAPPATTSTFQGHGDFVVVDAQPPLPTSKEQCKNGGWRDYGGAFENQGQCVAFVQRGPKP
jgi:hypothetical protein